MATAVAITERRQKVRDLWLMSTPAPKIAKALRVDERTIKRDIQVVRQQLVSERVTDLEQNLARSVAMFQRVQSMAFTVYSKAKIGSQVQVMALNAIADAEVNIAKLEGTMAPESVTAAAVVEMQAVLLETLADLGPAAVQTFHQKLQSRLHGGGHGSAAAASLALAAPTPATTVSGSIAATSAAASSAASEDDDENGDDDDLEGDDPA